MHRVNVLCHRWVHFSTSSEMRKGIDKRVLSDSDLKIVFNDQVMFITYLNVHEWRDIVRIRTEFDFVLIRVSILLQYRDSVTPA